MVISKDKDSSRAAKVFCMSSLRNELPSGLIGEIYGGKCQSPSLFKHLCRDKNILSDLSSIHIPGKEHIYYSYFYLIFQFHRKSKVNLL